MSSLGLQYMLYKFEKVINPTLFIKLNPTLFIKLKTKMFGMKEVKDKFGKRILTL